DYSRRNNPAVRGVCGIEPTCRHTLTGGRSHMTNIQAIGSRYVALLLLAVVLGASAALPAPDPVALEAKLSEWTVNLSQGTIAAGPATFTITNAGSIPHAFEVEGPGIEQETGILQPGA